MMGKVKTFTTGPGGVLSDEERRARNRDPFKWALLILFIVVVGAFAWQFKNFNADGVACNSNPFLFGAMHLAEDKGASVSCSCQVMTTPLTLFSFTEKDFKSGNPYAQSGNIPNISLGGYDGK